MNHEDNNGVHNIDGATEHHSTDPTLQASAKKRSQSPTKWVITGIIIAVIVAMIALAITLKPKQDNAAGSQKAASSIAIGLKLSPTNLDIRNTAGSALDQVLIGNVYQGLVARNANNEVVPALAKRWEVSDDGLRYTFHLHNNLTFSNGDPLTAQDVVWSINQLIEKQYHDADMLKNFKSISAPNEHTVVIELSKPYSNLLWALTGRAGLVFDKDAKYVAKTQAIGSGPYLVKKFTPNQSIELTCNPHYWGKAPKTDNITIKYYADDSAAVNALKSHEVQVLAPISANLAKPFEQDSEHYTVAAGDGTDKYVLAMNNSSDKPTGDKRVREAIRYAIDHDEIIASRGGADKALGGPIPSLDPGYEDLTRLYPHDVNKAKQLLKEAGYTKEHPLKLTLTYSNTYGSEIGDQLRAQLKQVNIDLSVRMVEFSTWLNDVYTNKSYDLSLVDHNESHDITQWANPQYYYNYNNPEVTKLIEEAQSATSTVQRDELLKQAARIISKDAAADWLLNYRVTTAMCKGVEGFEVNMNQTLMPLDAVTYTPQSKM